jgi:hypothetical protein
MNEQLTVLTNLTLAEIATNWCVYEVWHDDLLIYIGTCPLARVYTLPDARGIGEFVRIVQPRDPVKIIIKFVGRRTDCYNARGRFLRALPVYPRVNMFVHTKSQMVIVCDQDGQEYSSQSAVCAAYGLNQGNLSSHLNGKPGYARLKGFTFTRKPRSGQ